MDLSEDDENEQYTVLTKLYVWADTPDNAVAKAKSQLDRLPVDSEVEEVL